ncbi:MAG TPA: hemolysin family protein [Polyangiaceae bacterium]|nr:hemolysin family protein [Polyangiaceae bacterium]
MDPDPKTPELTLLLALLPALTAASYATITATLGSLSPARRAALKETLPERDRPILERYLKAPERIEARWLWLRVTGVAATSALLASAFAPLWPHAWLLGFLAAIFVYAVPSEIARPFATRRAERWLIPLLRALRPLEWLVAPLSDPLSFAARFLAEREPKPAPSAGVTETEVELLVNEGEQNGSLDHDQSEMIRNVLDFGELTAVDVMVPRIRVDALEVTLPYAELLRLVTETQHSRYPVYRDSIDNVVGVLHVKDLFAHIVAPGAEPPALDAIVRTPVVFVPEGQMARSVLHDMRQGRHHLAVVIDEFGGFSGIVTLEDLLEEIVGDIQDEHDLEDNSSIVVLDKDRVLVDASLPITDVNRHLGTDLPEGDYVSLGGLLLDQLGRVPDLGSEHQLLGLSVTIREADRRHIAKVELGGLPERPVTPPTPHSAEPSAA